MSQPKDPQRAEPTPGAPPQPRDASACADATSALRAYEPPEIVSSKIFHKVMMSTPQPGLPGCSTY